MTSDFPAGTGRRAISVGVRRSARIAAVCAVAFAAAPASGFIINGTAWDPGPLSARVAGDPAPGGATWSILAPGIGIHSNLDADSGGAVDASHRPLAATQDFDILLDDPGREIEMVGQVLDIWAGHSGFSNLGQVTDGGVAIGSPGLLASFGDLRIGVIESLGDEILAHAIRPRTQLDVASGGSAGGDIHIDFNQTWVDDPNDQNPLGDTSFDLFTVLLHETGHALGLAHSLDPDAVMFGDYAGARRNLTADDIAGIRSIYSVPEPATALTLGSGIAALAFFAGRRGARRGGSGR